MSLQTINRLLEKTNHYDKDERYMATNDICLELAKDIKLDDSTEVKLCTAITRQLDDESNDVQSIAVKCLALLLRKVKASQVGEVSDKLCTNILEGREQLRDIYCIGLKSLVNDVPEAACAGVCDRLLNRLLGGMQSKNDEVKQSCMEILSDLLSRFGHSVGHYHDSVIASTLTALDSPKPAIRKRATVCIGALAVCLSDPLLNRLLEELLRRIESRRGDARTLIQTIGTVSRMVGYRLGNYLERIVPIFINFCGDPLDERRQDDQSNELREHCFPGFEFFVAACPTEVVMFLDRIIKTCVDFIDYDPNYSYGDDDDNGGGDEEDEDQEYAADDADSSWKVRRAATRVLSAIIIARPEKLRDIYDAAASKLITCFRDREESVRVDIINCMGTLLTASMTRMNRNDDCVDVTDLDIPAISKPSLVRQRSTVPTLAELSRDIEVACVRQLNGRSKTCTPKVKSAALNVLRTMITVLRGGLSYGMSGLIDGLRSTYADRNQSVKIDTMIFLRMCIEKHNPADFYSKLNVIVSMACAAIHEEWYKLIAEGLRCVCALVDCMRPRVVSGAVSSYDMSLTSAAGHVGPLFAACLPRLSSTDIDQEIKECAISAVGKLVSHFGDVLGSNVRTCLDILIERLRNEVTRHAALRAITMIAISPLDLNIACVAQGPIEDIASFLRHQDRNLRIASLQCLESIFFSSSSLRMDSNKLDVVVTDCSRLLNDSDVQLANLSLKTVSRAIDRFPGHLGQINRIISTEAIGLSCSPVLQGSPLTSLCDFLKQLTSSSSSSNDIIARLRSVALSNIDENSTSAIRSYGNVAKCIAVITSALSPRELDACMAERRDELRSSKIGQKALALLTIGETGSRCNLNNVPRLWESIVACFQDESEIVTASAAFALGRCTVGSISSFLPLLLSAIQSHHQRYLVLSSLKELISCSAAHVSAMMIDDDTNNTTTCQSLDLSSHFHVILPILREQCQVDSEAVRNIVAECLGSLARNHSSAIIQTIQQILTSGGDVRVKWTAVTAFRYCIIKECELDLINTALPLFLSVLADEDLDVRRAAVTMVNAAAHHCEKLLAPYLLSDVMPHILSCCELRRERVVDLGPFKHAVDDALALRKASVLALESILQTLHHKVDFGAVAACAIIILQDDDDIKTVGFSILKQLCLVSPGTVLGSLAGILPPLQATIAKKMANCEGVDRDRAVEVIRSAVSVVRPMMAIAEVSRERSFCEFMERIRRQELVVNMMEEMKNSN